MDLDKQINYWKQSSQRDWKTAQSLFLLKRYDSCLFFCHLTLEKILKGLVVLKTKKTAPFIHDLERLSYIAEIHTNENQNKDLKDISAFNIAGRYSDYKFSFYKKCTKSYTQKYLTKTLELLKCLRKKYPKI
ncbi:hypothetical protein MNBD_UNCLBAC01-377 [hydrothermal vent metagenome]|uniref:HEPN domain-containing protein n=1 Tax=hydrothermal vent metagenome TaxID=652676 RepID=A0A3B1DEV5_9ZZZZ